MRWILRMAWRDSRGSRRRLLVFLSSIVVGVAALVAINGFGDNLEYTIDSEARTLLGADLSIESDTPFEEETEALFDSIGGAQSRRISLTSMAAFPPSGAARLVSVRALAGDYPFYGRLETEPPHAADSYRSTGGALVDATLLDQVGSSVGDSIRLGDTSYPIVGRLLATSSEPAAVMLFSPRVYVPLDDLDSTLLERGSRAEYDVFFKLPDNVDPDELRDEIRPHLEEFRLGSDTVEEVKGDWDRALTNLYRFLGLVALTALLLGGLGIGSAIHLYVRRRLESVAVLRCLGAGRARTSAVYVVQALGLGVLGSAAGCLLGIGLQAAVPAVLSDFLPVDVPFRIAWGAVATAFLAGVGLTLVFALLPLSAIANVSPLAAIRQAYETVSWRRNTQRIVIIVIMAIVIGAVSVAQAPRPEMGVSYAVGLLIVFLGLAAVGAGLGRALRRWIPSRAPYVWRQGLANLYRPNNQTTVLMVALGLGSFVVLTMVMLHATLLSQIEVADQRNQANVVLFDVQSDELAGVSDLVRSHQMPVIDTIPIVSMRIESVKGESVADMRADTTQRVSWAHRREYRSTYRGSLSDSERLVAGSFTARASASADVVPISVEAEIARELEVELGDTIVWNIHGIPVTSTVGSIREVDWNRMSANFFVVFPEGILEDAPQFFVVLTRAEERTESASLQAAMVAAFPTVSAIDLDLVIQVFETLYTRAAFVIRFMAMFSIITGLIVLAGAVLATRYERSREGVLLKALGAARRQVVRIMLVEYAFIGFFAALAGLILAAAGGWALAHFVFETDLVLRPMPIVGTTLAIVVLTIVIGMLTSRGTYDQPVLSVLRAET